MKYEHFSVKGNLCNGNEHVFQVGSNILVYIMFYCDFVQIRKKTSCSMKRIVFYGYKYGQTHFPG